MKVLPSGKTMLQLEFWGSAVALLCAIAALHCGTSDLPVLPAMVSAELDGRTATPLIDIAVARLKSLSLSPTAPQVKKGLTQAFVATAHFSDGTTQDVTEGATWSAKDLVGSGVVLLSTKGVATAESVGQASITAHYKTLSASTTLTVTAPALTALAISPTNPSLWVGGSLTFSAQGTFSDGTVQDVTAAADWGAADLMGSGVASMEGSTVTADSAGQATVSVFYEGLEANTILTVNPVPSSGWVLQSSGSTGFLFGVWGTDANHIWAVGGDGGGGEVILYWDGSAWRTQSMSTTFELHAIWGADVNNVWAAGDYIIEKWNGTSWASAGAPNTAAYYGAWGLDANNVWAVGADLGTGSGLISQWDGSSWGGQTVRKSSPFSDVWGLDANHIWAVGGNGEILQWDGSSWSVQDSGTTNGLRSVFGLDANHIWVVGQSGMILMWNGSSWASQASGTAQNLYHVWGSDAKNVWAVGAQGTILHWDGSAWVFQNSGTTLDLFGVFGLDANNVWAVGPGGTILRWQP